MQAIRAWSASIFWAASLRASVRPTRNAGQACRMSRPAVRPASTSCSTSGAACSFPKARPADRVATLSEGFGKLVKDEGFLWLMKAIHSNIAYRDHSTFAEYLTGEQKQLKELYETMKK